MKVRLSHVSNSSSASYFLSISNKSLDQIINDLLCEYSYDYFDRKQVVSKIKNRIKSIGDLRKTVSKQKKDKKLKSAIAMLNTQDEWASEAISELEGFLKTVNDIGDDNVALAKAVLDYNDIKIEVKKGKQKKPTIEFSYVTSMHNSFNDGMSKMFNEMVLFCINEYQAKFWMESDNEC